MSVRKAGIISHEELLQYIGEQVLRARSDSLRIAELEAVLTDKQPATLEDLGFTSTGEFVPAEPQSVSQGDK